MRKPSKYETMAKMKQIVKMSFADVQVTGYRNPKVTSKTGREYRKYEVEIDSVLWVSTTSFNKQSFSKRYFKAIENVKVVKEETPKQKFEIKVSDYCFKDDTKKSSTGFTFTREQLKGNVYGVDDETYNRAVDAIFVGSSHYLYNENYEKTVQVSSGAYIDLVQKDINDFQLLTFEGSVSYGFNYYHLLYKINKEQALKELREQRLVRSPKELFEFDKMMFDSIEPTNPTQEMNPYICLADRIMTEEVMVAADKWAEENWYRYEQRWQELEESLNEVNINVSTPDENEFSVHFRNCKTVKDVKKVYRSLAKQYHSDLGGSDEDMAKINTAYDRALSLVA